MFGDDVPAPRLARASWQEPFRWWGPPWQTPEPRSLTQLVGLEMLSGWQAAWLVDHMATGGSMVVAASPQGAGKSTLAAALIAELPNDRFKVYLRGMYEPFDWVNDSTPQSTTLLVNEISPHLPIYAWGETLRRLLALGEAGYQIVATMHADSVEEAVIQLANYPIEGTVAQFTALSVIVFITVTVANDKVDRRVGSIFSLERDGSTGGLIAQAVAE